MDMSQSIKTCFAKYIEFNGRASRSEYWWFFLFVFLMGFASSFFGQTTNAIVSLLLLLPYLAVLIRRLHDINRTGWWVLIGFVPLIGFIVLVCFAVMEGSKEENIYGAPTK